MTPAQVQAHVLDALRTGMPPAAGFEPGAQGAAVTGAHAAGVNTP